MKKMTIAIILALAAATSTAPSAAVVRFGGTDCGKWVTQKTEADKLWLLGYLSGMNNILMEWKTKLPDPLDVLSSADQAFLWMDNYCRANPLKSLDQGAHALYMELVDAAVKRKPTR